MNETNTQLHEKLSRLQWLMRKHHMRTHAQSGPMSDPTRGQGRIFALLKLQDGISTKDLSYLLGIRVSSLNELLAKMEKNGYITREPSEADKRIMLVRLTEKGRTQQQEEWNPGTMFACLAEEEQKTLGEYLTRIITALEGEIGTEEDEQDWWKRGGRERMGEELFERFAAMRRGGFAHGEGFHHHHHGGRHGFGGCPHSGGPHGRPGDPTDSPQEPDEE